MAVEASGRNTEILQFDWFMSGRIFPVLPTQGGFLTSLACVEQKLKFLTMYRVKMYNEQSEIEKLTM